MSDVKKLPRVDLPPGVRLDTLAVREGLPPSQWGENSEALFLTSSFVHPDAATAAARFANEEEAFIYSRFTNPTVMMFERRLAALEGTQAWRGPGHQAVLSDADGDRLVFHAYEGTTGKPTLRISTMAWEDGWPRVGELK